MVYLMARVTIYKTNPLEKDTDQDKLTDGQEVNFSDTSPLKKDSDADGITDDLDDQDNDSLGNLNEIKREMDPKQSDTDLDSLPDNQELINGTNPTDQDTDHDGLIDGNEIEYHMNPLNPDTDYDGILDGKDSFSVTINTGSLDKDTKVFPTLNMDLKGENIGTVTITNVGSGNF